MSIRRYSELIRLLTFIERYRYLRLRGAVGETTFGFDRYLNQSFYRSQKWRRVRDEVIIRDDGCDLGIEDRLIGNRIVVHHMNPLTAEEIEEEREILFDPRYLICVSPETHNAIHYGDESLLIDLPIERRPGDTRLW